MKTLKKSLFAVLAVFYHLHFSQYLLLVRMIPKRMIREQLLQTKKVRGILKIKLTLEQEHQQNRKLLETLYFRTVLQLLILKGLFLPVRKNLPLLQ